MRIQIELYYESQWVARGEGIYVTASSLLELQKRLALCLDEKDLPAPREIRVIFDRSRAPSWVLRYLKTEQEFCWKL